MSNPIYNYDQVPLTEPHGDRQYDAHLLSGDGTDRTASFDTASFDTASFDALAHPSAGNDPDSLMGNQDLQVLEDLESGSRQRRGGMKERKGAYTFHREEDGLRSLRTEYPLNSRPLFTATRHSSSITQEMGTRMKTLLCLWAFITAVLPLVVKLLSSNYIQSVQLVVWWLVACFFLESTFCIWTADGAIQSFIYNIYDEKSKKCGVVVAKATEVGHTIQVRDSNGATILAMKIKFIDTHLMKEGVRESMQDHEELRKKVPECPVEVELAGGMFGTPDLGHSLDDWSNSNGSITSIDHPALVYTKSSCTHRWFHGIMAGNPASKGDANCFETQATHNAIVGSQYYESEKLFLCTYGRYVTDLGAFGYLLGHVLSKTMRDTRTKRFMGVCHKVGFIAVCWITSAVVAIMF